MPENETLGVPLQSTLGVAGVAISVTGVVTIVLMIGIIDGSIMVITPPVSPPLLPVDAKFVTKVAAMSTKASWS